MNSPENLFKYRLTIKKDMRVYFMAQSPSYETYHETLHSAMDEAIRYTDDSDAIIDENELREQFATGGIPYGTTRQGHVAIQTLRTHLTRKWFHISIYRMDSGRYELTCYIL